MYCTKIVQATLDWACLYGEHKANKNPMPAAAILRAQIEEKLANRIPAVLSLKIKQASELLPTGIAEIDSMVGGGIPRGSITEISGA